MLVLNCRRFSNWELFVMKLKIYIKIYYEKLKIKMKGVYKWNFMN